MLDFPIYLNGRDYCSYSGCQRRPFTEGICHRHWWAWRYVNTVCTVDECSKPAIAKGYCSKHHQRVMKHGDPLKTLIRPPLYPIGQMPKTCIKEDCNRPSQTRGLCRKHYGEEYRWGEGGAPQRYELCPECRQHRYRLSWHRDKCTYCLRRQDVASRSKTHCAHWDRAMCLKAGREWYKLHGHAPRSPDWQTVGPYNSFPARVTITKLFGSWANYIKELGLPQRPVAQYKPPKVTWDECMTSGLAFVEEHGSIPSIPQWLAAKMSPGHVTIYRCFGSWVAFKDELAGATGLDPAYMRKAA